MLKTLRAAWDRFFFEERSSAALGFFRIAVAVTVGTHVIPTLIPMADNYLHTAFKEINPTFFPRWILIWIAASPDSVVILMSRLFYIFWFTFLVGFCSQLSCILMTLCCYYFYALNSLHIGTLSWDILLVTLFLMCLTNYPGDYFSVDAWLVRRKSGEKFQPPMRPFFIQRLLQFQLAWIYFYTTLCKITPGNWISDNPYYYLMNMPAGGVVRHFWFRDYLASAPSLCYFIGLLTLAAELFISGGLFRRKQYKLAVFSGLIFHLLLFVTLHVPTIFLFLFPPQFLLFLPLEKFLALGHCEGAKRPKQSPI